MTEMVHERPAPSVAGAAGQVVPLTPKPLDTLIPEIVSAVAWAFFNVTVDAAEAVFTFVDAKVTLAGLTVVWAKANVEQNMLNIATKDSRKTLCNFRIDFLPRLDIEQPPQLSLRGDRQGRDLAWLHEMSAFCPYRARLAARLN